ncbi:hypothetical protein CPC08DRAFT_713315 [Agrocybe pediades]|nr:hypothetical protein CPC08DRAFT_713315 [Agrocybe pediades]
MDVDVPQPTRFSPFINFFDVTNNFPWQEPRPEQIRHRRTLMDDSLIFDILLRSGGVLETYSLYPPETQQGLQNLLDAIASSHYDTLKKDCLVYFLLKWHQDGRERYFQQQRCIPPQFVALADAYWYLDTGINVPKAVAILSDLRLNREHVSKIIRAISLSPESEPLIRRYVQTAKPALVEPMDIECYTLALAESSIREAWEYTRTFDDTENMRTRLLRRIFEWSVTPKPRPAALKQLLALPLSTMEESVLNQFVQKAPHSMKFQDVAILQDLVCVRLIQGGRYSEAIKLDHQFTSITSHKNLKLTRDRSSMVKEVYSALSAVERALLDLELDPTIPKTAPLTPKPATPQARRSAAQPKDSPLSQSWEDVRVPDALLNKTTPLKDVRVPPTPNIGNSSLFASTSSIAATAPIFPIDFGNSVASGSGPRKSLALTSSVLGHPRNSMSGVASRMAFNNGPAIASPVSGMKIPAPTQTPQKQPHVFVSASSQPNAFYQPPPTKTNGVKRSFEDITMSPGQPEVTSPGVVHQDADGDQDMEGQKEDDVQPVVEVPQIEIEKKDASLEQPDDEGAALEYSVFESESRKKPRPSSKPASKKATRRAPPGSFVSEDEEATEEEHNTDSQRKKRPARVSAARAATSDTASKPPAKKARKVKDQDLSRSIPGSYGGEENEEVEEVEEEDRVAPLPSPPKRAVRKGRSSSSMEVPDDFEGVKTRRRSSRLTTGGSVAGSSVNGGSPEQPATKRKGTRSAGAAKKKR